MLMQGDQFVRLIHGRLWAGFAKSGSAMLILNGLQSIISDADHSK